MLAQHALRGLGWYEVSNWGEPCRHNLGYWRGDDWWGVGPGAHSHVGGVRWWNVKHPKAYADRMAGGVSPGAGREVLGDEDRRVERILLEVGPHSEGRAVLTLRGRLLADAVVRDLVD